MRAPDAMNDHYFSRWIATDAQKMFGVRAATVRHDGIAVCGVVSQQGYPGHVFVDIVKPYRPEDTRLTLVL